MNCSKTYHISLCWNARDEAIILVRELLHAQWPGIEYSRDHPKFCVITEREYVINIITDKVITLMPVEGQPGNPQNPGGENQYPDGPGGKLKKPSGPTKYLDGVQFIYTSRSLGPQGVSFSEQVISLCLSYSLWVCV